MPTPDSPIKLEKSLMRDDVYSRLRDWIVTGTLEPEEKLRDADLAGQLGISRTPVREALRRLEDEGLIETKQNAWTRVAPVTHELAARIYPILQVLEPLALERALPRMTRADIKTMRRLNGLVRQALKRGDAKAAALNDTALHEALTGLSTFEGQNANPELSNIIATLKTNHIRLEITYWRGGPAALESVLEHERIIQALEQTLNSHDSAPARLAFEAHWQTALERWNAP
jgi:DNA-binding GntR family transcriptional regulator